MISCSRESSCERRGTLQANMLQMTIHGRESEERGQPTKRCDNEEESISKKP